MRVHETRGEDYLNSSARLPACPFGRENSSSAQITHYDTRDCPAFPHQPGLIPLWAAYSFRDIFKPMKRKRRVNPNEGRGFTRDVFPHRTLPANAVISILMALSTASASQSTPGLTFHTAAALESFVLSGEDSQISQALSAALETKSAGGMIKAAVAVGPAQASQVAASLTDPGFRQGYRDLAKYLDLYAPCHKKSEPDTQGWWSNYPDPPSEQHCVEAVKLLFSALLWNQVHYCSRLASGAERPRQSVTSGKQPPYRLDEPPVATHWLHPEALYSIADAALRFEFSKTLRARTAAAPERVRAAMLAAADELDQQPPNREQVALSIAKLLLRRFEQSHAAHLPRP